MLVIRGQAHLTSAQVQAPARSSAADGRPEPAFLVDGHPLISVSTISTDSKGSRQVGKNATWHTDRNQERPPKFTMLYAVVPDKGRPSVWLPRAACEALPDETKIWHEDGEHADQQRAARSPIRHPGKQLRSKRRVQPLVRTHPESGKKAVRFHKSKTEKIIGMTPEDTQEFLQDLTDRVTQPQFCYAHQYQVGDLLILDDRQSLHKAGHDFDPSQHRRLYRMLVRGDRRLSG